MKKLLFAMIGFAALLSFAACSDNETYADQRNRELDSINAFLRNENIKVITEQQFKERFAAGVNLTDTAKDNNEYVLFESNGIYMQVVDQGCGDYIQQGTTVPVLVRFSEFNINTLAAIRDKQELTNNVNLTLSNNLPLYVLQNAFGYSYPGADLMNVTNTSGTFQASFNTSTSLMAFYYGSSSYSGTSGTVPSGWLVPFSWVKVGRGNGEGEKIAHVRLLIPHTYGTTSASGNVNAYFYDLTFQKGR